MPQVLLVEDAEDCQVLVKSALKDVCGLDIARSAEEASGLLTKKNFDLIILDIGLPDRSGYQLCSELRSNKETQDVPIFMLTGRSDISDKVAGFSLGADDYIVKPFSVLEFQARVAARLKRYSRQKESNSVISFPNISLSALSHEVKIRLDDNKEKRVDLTPHECRLLQVLMINPDTVLTRDRLLSLVWGTDTFVEDRTIDKHISSLRKKLENYSNYIQTVTGIGYRFSVNRNQ